MLDFKDNPQFRFYFDIRGVETYQLDQAPNGWLETIIEYANSKSYVGLRRSLSLPYKFVGNAAMLCRREYYQYLLAAQIVLRIDMRQNDLSYTNIYTGKLNFADPATTDSQTSFIVPSVSNDFSLNIDAYDSVAYSIPLTGGINLELPPILLNETAELVISAPPDGKIHSDYFPQIQVVNNTQNALNPTVQSVAYNQIRLPDYGTENNSWFMHPQANGFVYVTGVISFRVDTGSFVGATLKFQIVDAVGTVLHSFYDAAVPAHTSINVNQVLNFIMDVERTDYLFLYIQQVEAEEANTGITVTSSDITLSYQTSSPATMTQAISGDTLFALLLQAMNPNLNSGPNLPVPYQTFLLNTVLKNVYFTCSDSIKSGQGSFYNVGDTIGQGVYQVIQGTISYDGEDIAEPALFGFDGTLTFGQVGAITPIVQKIESIFVGNVYNAGDSLEPGGVYLVEGVDPTWYATYNGVNYPVGQFFSYVLGQDTFTISNALAFVKQISESAQIVISFADFFQAIKSFMGGNAAFGERGGVQFLEDLTTVYQAVASGIDLGNVPIDWKSSPAVDLLYANFKLGYNDQQYTVTNGYQEVNSTQIYSSGLMLSPAPDVPNTYPNELNLISPIRADCLGIEELRISQNDTASSRSNNDTWAIWINPTAKTNGAYVYYSPALPEDSLKNIYGVPDGFYNYFLSPKQNFLRGAPYFASIFYNMGDYPITLASALKNSSLVTIDLTGRRVAERDSVLVSSLGSPLFIPVYFTAKQNIGFEVLNSLAVNPYSPLKFEVNGVAIEAFINDFKLAPASNASQDIKLLLTPNNSLLDLIR